MLPASFERCATRNFDFPDGTMPPVSSTAAASDADVGEWAYAVVTSVGSVTSDSVLVSPPEPWIVNWCGPEGRNIAETLPGGTASRVPLPSTDRLIEPAAALITRICESCGGGLL